MLRLLIAAAVIACDAGVLAASGPGNSSEDGPVLVPDVAVTDHRKPVVVNVLENDGQAGGMRLVEVTKPSRGRVAWTPDGAVAYFPEPGYAGAVAMTYTARDAGGRKSSSTLTVTSRICYAMAYREAGLECERDKGGAGQIFTPECRQVEAGWVPVETPCS